MYRPSALQMGPMALAPKVRRVIVSRCQLYTQTSEIAIAKRVPSGDKLGRKYESGLASSGCVFPSLSNHCTVTCPLPAVPPLRYRSTPVCEKSNCAEPLFGL